MAELVDARDSKSSGQAPLEGTPEAERVTDAPKRTRGGARPGKRKPYAERLRTMPVPSGLTEAEIVAAAQPLPVYIGVYCFVRGDRVVYVGVSNDVLKRFYEHRRESVRSTGGKVFDRVAFFPCENREEADRLEHKLIQELRPEYNFKGLPDKVRTPKWWDQVPSAEEIAKRL